MTSSLSPSERSYIITGLSHPNHPTRQDGRGLLTPRAIEITYNEAPQANGSSRVVLGGGTEVVAGIKLEVTDVSPGSGGKGKEGWRGRIEVDVTPQAYPQLTSSALSLLSTQFADFIIDHFLPSVPALPILPPTKYFVPHLHLTLLSSSSGSVPTALILASRAAFTSLRIPRIKRIGWEAITSLSGEDDQTGIKGAVNAAVGKGKGKVRYNRGQTGPADEWDLDMEGGGDGMEYMIGREELPVLVTLNLIPNTEIVFIDASVQEEIACPDRIHVFVTSSGKLCGIRMEGATGLAIERIKPLLVEGKRIAGELITGLNRQFPT